MEKAKRADLHSALWHCCTRTMREVQSTDLHSNCWHCCSRSVEEVQSADLHFTCRHCHPRAIEGAQKTDLHSTHQHHHPGHNGGTDCRLLPSRGHEYILDCEMQLAFGIVMMQNFMVWILNIHPQSFYVVSLVSS